MDCRPTAQQIALDTPYAYTINCYNGASALG
jgi:hypothetical protein